jgi:hypothetical protein
MLFNNTVPAASVILHRIKWGSDEGLVNYLEQMITGIFEVQPKYLVIQVMALKMKGKPAEDSKCVPPENKSK